MREDLSVRQVEELVQRLKGKRAQRARRDEATTQLRHLAERLQRKPGAKVDLKDRGGSGSVEIRYASHAELDRIISAILAAGRGTSATPRSRGDAGASRAA